MLPDPDKPYGFCGRKATLNQSLVHFSFFGVPVDQVRFQTTDGYHLFV